MKITKIFFTFLMFLVGAYSLHAQSVIFKVIASTGKNTIQATQKIIYAGTTLKDNDQIIVVANGYVGLMHQATGKTIEIKKPGTYAMKQLIPTASGSTTSRYVNYVADQMAKVEKENINVNHRRYSAVTGSVNRATGLVPLLVYSPEKTSLFDHQIVLAWASNEKYKNYDVKIENSNLKKLFSKIVVNDTSIALNFDDILSKNSKKHKSKDSVFYISINNSSKSDLFKDLSNLSKPDPKATSSLDKEKTGIRLTIKILDQKQKDMLKEELAPYNTEETALNYLVKAKIFEDKKCYLDALECYRKAIRLEPEVETYKKAYLDFMASNNIIYEYKK